MNKKKGAVWIFKEWPETIEEDNRSSDSFDYNDDVYTIDQLEKMWDFGKTSKDQFIEKMIRDDL